MGKTRIPPQKMAAWIELIRVQNRLLKTIETALKDASLPPLTWYDVLLELTRPDHDGLRPMELEKRLLLPQYGMSRLLDRMDKEGLIVRHKAPGDGRGQVIQITEAGRKIQARMWPVYASALDDAFAHKLTMSDARDLHRVLMKIARGPAA